MAVDRLRVVPAVILFLLAACAPARTRPEPSGFERFQIGREGRAETRDAWFWDQRAFPAGSVPVEVHRRAVAAELALPQAAAADGEEWIELGPRPLRDLAFGDFGTKQHSSGRLLTVAPHPTDPDVVFAGAAQGGIWKSTDRGATFRPVGEESLPTLAVNVIRFDPTTPEVIYAGTGEAHGSISILGAGIVKSVDGGETWELLPSRGEGWNFEFASITGIVVDPRNSNVVWASSATILTYVAPPSQPPSGVFRSDDGGRSWRLVLAAKRHQIEAKVAPSAGVMDLEHGGAGHPDLLYASEYYGGIYRSDDAGESWTLLTPALPDGLGTLPATVAAVDAYDGRTRTYQRWTRLPHPSGSNEFRRIELGVSPANPEVIYAGYDSIGNRLDRNGSGVFDNGDLRLSIGLLFKSSDRGETWSWLGSWADGAPDYCSSQCFFDNVVAVNPEDADEVIIAGSANYVRFWPDPFVSPTRLLEMPWRGMVYRSTDGGESWSDLTPHCTRIASTPRTIPGVELPVYQCAEMDSTRVIHPDTHGAAWAADGALWIANDGGLYRTTDGSRWENLNDSLGTLQFYKIAVHPTDPDIMLGGMQDNSAGYWNGSTWEGWGAGDGTIAAFDPIDPRWVYLGSQFLVHRHQAGGTKDLFDDSWTIGIFGFDQARKPESTSFVPVFAMDGHDPRILYAGTDRAVYRSDDRGDSWTRLTNEDLDGKTTTIDAVPGDSKRIWVGTSTGHIYRYDLGSDAPRQRAVRRQSNDHDWTPARVTDVSTGLPDRSVSRVLAPSAADPDLVFAVFTGYDANTPSTPGKVFVSRDGGSSWENVSGGLPDVPVSALAADPRDAARLWVGTDVAVYASTDGGLSWQSERGTMPVVSVLDLQYNPVTGYLVAATHGRGIWRKRIGGSSVGR